MIRAEIRTKAKTMTGSARFIGVTLKSVGRKGNSRFCILFGGGGNLSFYQ
jgi:hypothetical protein